ncbi:hypothetical protein [Halogeometricum borinquense]|uniref:Uncharacterized conserved protein n=3 Tax=Halogeometricum borinquense (strain ATCC 700274 / DSM 11551 / JCM 10706 / KCTC 4070 / PR3) TaxID=469382 RepID=E4NNC7_HALBP|nr:hypothetical protein [Halogeometricum borinquense]ADQ67465.1 uncharacterized conserved protein [Halogeometricum borinquense DSM 11551]
MSAVENRREVAYRIFAAEFDDASLSYSEGDEERAPNYVVTPTGARVNRLFAVGALTEVESVNDEVLRGRIADPTGVFVTYAGQYQPEAMNFLDRSTPPMFVSITGKARTYEPDDSDRVFTSVRPESINEVDAGTRDRWVVAAARATLERVATMQAALAMDHRGDDLRAALEARGVDESLAMGVPLAIDHYGTTEHYLEAVRTLAVQALELVADKREAVDSLTVAPDETGPSELGPVPDVAAATAPEGGDVAITESDESEASGSEPVSDEPTESAATAADEPATTEADATAEKTEPATETEPVTETEPAPTTDETEPETPTESGSAEAAADAETVAATDSGTSEAAADTPEPESSAGGLGDFDAGTSESETSETTADTSDSAGGLGDFDADDSVPSGSGDTESAPEAIEPDAETSDPTTDTETAADTEPTTDTETATADSPSEAVQADAAADASSAMTGEMYEMDDEERAEIEAEFGAEFSTGNEVADPGEADIDVPDADELEAEGAEASAETNGETPSGVADSSDTVESDTTEAATEPKTEMDEPLEPETDETPESDTDETASDESKESGKSEQSDESEQSGKSEVAADTTEATDEPAEDVDLEVAVVDVMADLDDGDGADHDAVVSTIVEQYGADADAVEDAIQDALMSGKCYEPSEGTLKSI